MLDVSRKVVPDKDSLNRERPVTTTFKSPSCTTTVSFPAKLERSVRKGVYTYIQDDRYGGWVPSKAKANKVTKTKTKRKRKVAILKKILSLTGSQRSALCKKECIHTYRMTGMVAGYHQKQKQTK